MIPFHKGNFKETWSVSIWMSDDMSHTIPKGPAALFKSTEET